MRNFYVRDAFRILLRVQPSSSPLLKNLSKNLSDIISFLLQILNMCNIEHFLRHLGKKKPKIEHSFEKISQASTFVSLLKAGTDNISFLPFIISDSFSKLI